MNILLIEDNEEYINLFQDTLEKSTLRYVLTVSRSFDEAKNLIENENFNILISAYILPDSGGEHINYLIESGLPVIVLTAYGCEKAEVHSVKKGVLNYISKSSDSLQNIPQIIQNCIREWENTFKKKEAELALKESRQKFKTIAEKAPFPIIIAGWDNTVLYSNQKANELFEISDDDLRQIKVTDYFYYDISNRKIIVEELENKGFIKDFELQMKTLKGRIFWAAMSANTVEFYDKKCNFIIIRDITELRNNRENLAQSETLFRSIIDSAKDFIFIKDSALRYIKVNKAMAQLFDIPVSKMLWKTDRDLFSPDQAKKIEEVDRRALAGQIVEENQDIEIKGETRSLNLIIMPLRDSNGLIVGLYGIVRDVTNRVKIEKALRKSEELLHLVTDNMIDLVIYLDENLSIIFASPSVKQELGWEISEIAGKELTSLIHEENADRFTNTVKRAVNDSVTRFKMEFRYKHKNGDTIWFESECSVFYEHNQFKGIIFGSRNIHKRKKTEEELKNRERILLGIAKTSQLLLSGKDFSELMDEILAILGESTGADRVSIFENMEIEKTGKTVTELKFEWVREAAFARKNTSSTVIIPDDLFSTRWKSLLEDGRTLGGKTGEFPKNERAILFLQGIKSFLATPIIINGSLWGIICFDSVTTEKIWSKGEEAAMRVAADNIATALARKRSETEFRKSEEKFKSSIENAPLAIYILSLEGKIIYGNKRSWQLFECKSRDVVGKKTAGHFWVDSGQFDKWLHSLQRKNVVADYETKLSNYGRTREFLALVSGVVINHMDSKAVLAVHDDISEKKLALDQRLNLERQVQSSQKLESLGVLAGGIAHDFNNLLGVIMGYADLALTKLPKTDLVRADLEEIILASQRASDLCQQMLTYSGKVQMRIHQLDLLKLVKDTAALLKVSISKKVDLDFNLPGKIPLIEADASQIDQILLNLVINASESIECKSGTICISLNSIDCDKTYLNGLILGKGLPEGKYICLRVSDTGKGIKREVLERMFEPFYTTKFSGRGLGLSVVMGIVKSHKGALDVKSIPGEGTAVSVFFPALSKKIKKTKERRKTDNWKWKGKGAILLADDEQVVLEMCREMLEYLGFEVLLAANGQEAVEIFKKNRSSIKCNIIDLTMPNMDGEEVFKEIRKIEPDAKIIIASGYGEKQIQKKFKNKDLSAFIQKPFSIRVLRSALQKVLK